MITYLIDSNICIHAMKSRNYDLAHRLDEITNAISVSSITIFELHAGAHGYAEPDKRLAVIERFLTLLKIIPFTTEAARIAGALRHRLASNGQLIGGYDLLIAATALDHDLTLMTNNTREFSRIKELRLESWPLPS